MSLFGGVLLYHDLQLLRLMRIYMFFVMFEVAFMANRVLVHQTGSFGMILKKGQKRSSKTHRINGTAIFVYMNG